MQVAGHDLTLVNGMSINTGCNMSGRHCDVSRHSVQLVWFLILVSDACSFPEGVRLHC